MGDGSIHEATYYSIGGGEIISNFNEYKSSNCDVYPHNNFEEIKKYCKNNQISLFDYIIKHESKDLISHLEKC